MRTARCRAEGRADSGAGPTADPARPPADLRDARVRPPVQAAATLRSPCRRRSYPRAGSWERFRSRWRAPTTTRPTSPRSDPSPWASQAASSATRSPASGTGDGDLDGLIANIVEAAGMPAGLRKWATAIREIAEEATR